MEALSCQTQYVLHDLELTGIINLPECGTVSHTEIYILSNQLSSCGKENKYREINRKGNNIGSQPTRLSTLNAL